MKKLAAVLFAVTASSTAFAQPGPEPQPADCCTDTEAAVQTQPTRPIAAASQPSGYAPAAAPEEPKDNGWGRPPGERFLHGMRIGWTYIFNFNVENRTPDEGDTMVSVKDKFGLKTPHMMLIGYEGMYRIIGHSWLNVVFVGNV